MNEFEKMWTDIEQWWHLLWHHAQADTLEKAPAAGGVPATIPPIGGTVTAPAPPLPKPAAFVLPDGVTWADEANGLVSIAALEQYYPGRKYAVKQAEDFLTPGTAAYISIVQNVQNSTFSDAHGMEQVGVFHPAKPNGLTAGYSLDTSIKLDNVFVCPDKYPTFESVIAWCTATAQAVAANPANQDGGSGHVPGH